MQVDETRADGNSTTQFFKFSVMLSMTKDSNESEFTPTFPIKENQDIDRPTLKIESIERFGTIEIRFSELMQAQN